MTNSKTNNEIVFENDKEPQGNWTWHYGELKQNGKAFPFSLLEMYEPTNDTYSHEITWCEDTPDNNEELENEIMDKFNN